MSAAPVLLGPADPDHFRTKVGRFKDRWYVDPLDADDIAPATDKAWPAVSTVKGVSTPSWNQSQAVAVKRIARAYRQAPGRLNGLDERDTIAVLSMWNEGDLSRAGDRGTAAHHYIEYVKLRGMPAMIDLSPAGPYTAAIDAFFDAYQPSLVAAEIPVVHRHLNGVGYGGTIDAVILLTIDGKRYLVDWKSRGEDSEHGAYTEEAAQIGAYYGGEYCIMDRDGAAVRVPMDELRIDGGLLVSIRPDGCRVYPVDLPEAFDYFTAMHAWWNSSRTATTSIGRPWAPVPMTTTRHLSLVPDTAPLVMTTTTGSAVPGVAATALQPAARRERLIARISELIAAGHGPALMLVWPPGVPGLTASTHTDVELVAILAAVEMVSDAAGLPWHDDDGADGLTGSRGRHPSNQPTADDDTESADYELTSTPAPPVVPVEGADVDVGDLHALHARYVNLTPEQRAWIGVVAAHADQAGRSISLNARPSLRRYEIGRCLVLAVERTWNDTRGVWADQFLRAVLAAVTNTTAIDTDLVPFGALMAELSPDEASWMSDILQALGTDALVVGLTPDNTYTLGGPVMSR